jgi:hypothetical protein
LIHKEDVPVREVYLVYHRAFYLQYSNFKKDVTQKMPLADFGAALTLRHLPKGDGDLIPSPFGGRLG